MKQQIIKNTNFYTYVILGIFLLFLQSCSSKQLYYKPGKYQHDFDIDSKECEIIAQNIALEKSQTGRRAPLDELAKAYQQCIAAKGWSTTPPETAQNQTAQQIPTEKLAVLENDILNGFGLSIIIPPGSKLQNHTSQVIGPTIMESFLLSLSDGTYINVIFQKATKYPFIITEYPIQLPYRLYSRSYGKKNYKPIIRAASFYGNLSGEWVMGQGSYYNLSKKERIIIVVTQNLEQPSNKPPENLHLSKNQHESIEKFLQQWQPWMESVIQTKPSFSSYLKDILL